MPFTIRGKTIEERLSSIKKTSGGYATARDALKHIRDLQEKINAMESEITRLQAVVADYERRRVA